MKKNVKKLLAFTFLLSIVLFLVSCTNKIQVTGIEISSLPTKVNYVEGEIFDATGLEVKKVMSDSSRVVITNYTIDKMSELTVDDTVITVKYGKFSAIINITVEADEPTVRRLVDVELKVEENFLYTRTMDLSSHVEYREVYSDDTYEEWAQLSEEDLINYTIEDDQLKVTASLLIKNKEWIKEITIPVKDDYISVDTLLTKDVDGTSHLVNGILVAITSTMSRTEYILQDKESDSFIGVSGLSGSGLIYEYTLDVNGFEIGDELRLPVKLVRAKTENQYSDSNKLYAEFAGGNILSTAVVTKDNTFSSDKDNAIVINNQEELVNFLDATNRSDNFYKLVKFHGKMRYIYYANSKHYRFFFDENIKTLAGQLIDNCSPCFANGTQYYTTSNTIGEMLFNDKDYAPASWDNPGTATKDIYALFIGGNTYYHEFVILSADDVNEVTPVLKDTRLINPRKLAYVVGDEFDLTGGKIVYTYDYGDNKEVDLSEDMLNSSTLPNMDVGGEYTVIGSYEGFDFSFYVTVTSKKVSLVELSGDLDKTNFHIRESFEDVKTEIGKLQLLVYYTEGDPETIDITDNMISFNDEWTIGTHVLTISYLGEFTTVSIMVENQGISVTEIKNKLEGDEIYDLHGVVISSAFISGTVASPTNGEILIKDLVTSQVIGLKGVYINTANKLGGLDVGDEILVKVKVIITSTQSNHSEYGKLAVSKDGEDEIIVLSRNNNTMLDFDTATLIASQEQFDEFLQNATTRVQNAYKLIKLCAGAKIVAYSLDTASSYITFTGTNSSTCKIDGISPFLHEMNQSMTLGEDTYLKLLFGEDAVGNTSFTDGNVLDHDVYLMYIGGQGIYYHQFVLLGKEYVCDDASKNLKEIKYTQPTKVTYEVGEEIDFTGGMIEYQYYYSNQNVTIDLDASLITSNPIDMNISGQYTIQFTHAGITYDYIILVTSAELESIEIETLPDKVVYSHRDGIDTLDLAGGIVKLIYSNESSTTVDLTRAMLPENESVDWKIGVVQYVVTYEEKTTSLSITYENQAISVNEFSAKTSGSYDVTGIVVGPISSFGAAELLLKDENSMDIVGIYNTGVVGSYNAIDLDTSILNIGDKVIVKLTSSTNTKEGGSQGKYYGNAVNKDTFIANLIVESSDNDIAYDFIKTTVTEISSQQDLIAFLNNSDRFYTYVKLTGVKAVFYNGSYRIFFGDEITSLSEQKVNGYSPYIYKVNSDYYIDEGMTQYFDNNTSTNYTEPVTTEYDIYVLFVGGNTYYHCFAILDASWFVEKA